MPRKSMVSHNNGIKCLRVKEDQAGKKGFEFGTYQRADLAGYYRENAG